METWRTEINLPEVTQNIAELSDQLAWTILNLTHANTEALVQAVSSETVLLRAMIVTSPGKLYAHVEAAQTDIPKDQYIS